MARAKAAAPKRCRVLQVIPQDGIGGVEAAARSMLARDDLSCDFKLLLIAGRPLSPAPGRVVETGFGFVDNPLAHLAAVRAILREAPDVLICSLWRSVPATLFAKLLRPRTRLVFFLHLERTMHLADRILSRIGLVAADEVWADSDVTLAARRVPPGKPRRVISFVIDRLQRGADAPLSPRFVSWARLNHQKGTDRALRFIRALVDRGVDARFAAWGPDGGELAALQALARQLDLQDRVTFPGPAPREQLPAIASDHSFFLQLSRFEGMAMGVVEAMQLGLVPVTTPVGQMADYVRSGETGVLADPDDLDRSADELVEILKTPCRFDALRRAACARWQAAALYGEDLCAAALAAVRRPGA